MNNPEPDPAHFEPQASSTPVAVPSEHANLSTGEIVQIKQDETITIPMADYQSMVDRLEWLDCLEAAGVDNWQGYDEAQRMYQEIREAA